MAKKKTAKKRGRPPKKKPESTTTKPEEKLEEGQNEQQETDVQLSKKSRFDKLVGKKLTPDGKKVRAVVMTPDAAKYTDDIVKRPESKYFNNGTVHKPRG